MAVRLDYVQHIAEHHVETRYIHLVLDGWSAWSASERGPQRPSAAGAVLRIISVLDGKYRLRISDDEFTLVDSRIAVLPGRLREIVDLEYRGLWRARFRDLSQEDKWRCLGLKRTAYGARLVGAQWALHTLLMPHVEAWRKRNL